MPISRSAVQVLRSLGLADDILRPAARLDVDALLVHTTPLKSPPLPSETVLRDFEGHPAPDRNLSRPWPGQPTT